MSATPDHRSMPFERVNDLPGILKAMRAAVREAMLRHKQLGLPVAVWREEHVVWLSPDEIVIEPEDPESGGA